MWSSEHSFCESLLSLHVESQKPKSGPDLQQAALPVKPPGCPDTFVFRGNVLKDTSSCQSWHDQIFIWNTCKLCVKQNFKFCGIEEI